MAPKRVLAAVVCATLVTLGTAALAEEYRAGDFFNLDLSKAVLSPKRLGPPAEFAPVPVEARADSKQVVAEPEAEHQYVVRTKRIAPRVERPRAVQAQAEKPRPPARTKLARRQSNPLEAQARDRNIQTWPCKSGGICDWKR